MSFPEKACFQQYAVISLLICADFDPAITTSRPDLNRWDLNPASWTKPRFGIHKTY